MTPKISFIVSAYDRPRHLACVLSALAVQTLAEIEVIVVDNQAQPTKATENFYAIQQVRDWCCDRRFSYLQCMMAHCYHSAEQGARKATGEWLCFPSDDNYYVPAFAELMVKAVETEVTMGLPAAGFVYCDMVYDPRLYGSYSVVDVKPTVDKIDKGGFLVRRDLFLEVGGFPDKEKGILCDGLFIEELVRRGVRGVKAPGVLWVHN